MSNCSIPGSDMYIRSMYEVDRMVVKVCQLSKFDHGSSRFGRGERCDVHHLGRHSTHVLHDSSRRLAVVLEVNHLVCLRVMLIFRVVI
jgi:hypothetical protein